MKNWFSYLLMLSPVFSSFAQTREKMDFEKYDPVSTLKVPEHPLSKSKFPFIDVHNHQWSMPTDDLSVLVNAMDKLNMAVMVNLSGSNGSRLKQSIQNINSHYLKRFIVFANI